MRFPKRHVVPVAVPVAREYSDEMEPNLATVVSDDMTPPPVLSPYSNYETDDLFSSRLPHQYLDRYPSDHDEHGEEKENVNPGSCMVAAGVASAVVASLLLGPFVGTIAGFGSAYATQKEGATGDIARAIGEVALITGDKARAIDQKHRIVDHTKKIIADAWERAKELDQEHHILDRAKDFVAFIWQQSVSFTRRHRILEKSVEATGRGLEWLFRQVHERRIENGEGRRIENGGGRRVENGEGRRSRPRSFKLHSS